VNQTNNSVSNSTSAIKNLTALWAFSEGFLGGILNAVKIPFKGLLLGNISVSIIIFIANFTKDKGAILKAGTITTIVKAIISPYSSLPAYFAVFMQTILGEFFFLRRKIMILSGIMLGIITSVLSSFQRIVILTLLFGNAFWETIDGFAAYIYNEFFGSKTVPPDFKLSNWLIGVYIFIHAVVGFIVGLYVSRLAKKIKNDDNKKQAILEEFRNHMLLKEDEKVQVNSKKKSKLWKASRILLYAFLLVVLVLSYVLIDADGKAYFDSKSVWIMLLRSIVIMVLWFKVIGPSLSSLLRKRLMKSQNKYSEEIHYTLGALPFIKQLFAFGWKKAEGKGFRKVSNFVSLIIPPILSFEIEDSNSKK